MDATRSRRLRDQVRQRWYSHKRCLRFARHLGFTSMTVSLNGLASDLEEDPPDKHLDFPCSPKEGKDARGDKGPREGD